MGRLRLNPISAFAAHPRHVVGDWEAGGGRYICLRSGSHELNELKQEEGVEVVEVVVLGGGVCHLMTHMSATKTRKKKKKKHS